MLLNRPVRAAAACAALIVLGTTSGPGWAQRRHGLSAQVGHHLSSITPQGIPGNGRGIEVRPGSSIGYVTSEGSDAQIYKINMHSGAKLGTVNTNLETVCGRCRSYGFGALSWQPAKHVLWGSEYTEGGWIVKINPVSGAVTRVFDASAVDALDTGVDGLAVGSDGSLWVSGDGTDSSTSTTIDHFSSTGALLGSFTVPFGNSGIVVDGPDLWLADYAGSRILEYTQDGRAVAGMSFPTTGISDPEDLSLDTCTFPGKTVLWAYSADFGGDLAAYEVGLSPNTGCSGRSGGSGGSGGSGSGPGSVAVGSRGQGTAGRPVLLNATGPEDPTGRRLVYIWIFGDQGSHRIRAPGRVRHLYACPGFYPLAVTIESRLHRVIRRIRQLVVVQFAPGATRSRQGLKMRPVAILAGRRLSFYLSTLRLRRGGTRVTGVDWSLDGVELHGRTARTHVRYRLGGRRGLYRLRVAVHLDHARPVLISSCLFA
jgi:hypothetical protein